MVSFQQRLADLIDAYKDMESAKFSITIQKSIDPTRRPSSGLKSAISAQVALQNAQKEILVLVGPTIIGYYYR